MAIVPWSIVIYIVFGAPYQVDKSYGAKGLYRSGGITSLIKKGTEITLGRNIFTDRSYGENIAEELRYHENYHIQQQEKWAGVHFMLKRYMNT